jgi:hypothetical protein
MRSALHEQYEGVRVDAVVLHRVSARRALHDRLKPSHVVDVHAHADLLGVLRVHEGRTSVATSPKISARFGDGKRVVDVVDLVGGDHSWHGGFSPFSSPWARTADGRYSQSACPVLDQFGRTFECRRTVDWGLGDDGRLPMPPGTAAPARESPQGSLNAPVGGQRACRRPARLSAASTPVGGRYRSVVRAGAGTRSRRQGPRQFCSRSARMLCVSEPMVASTAVGS